MGVVGKVSRLKTIDFLRVLSYVDRPLETICRIPTLIAILRQGERPGSIAPKSCLSEEIPTGFSRCDRPI
jgi:hypothetical protein